MARAVHNLCAVVPRMISMARRSFAFCLIVLAACGRIAPGEFCTRAHAGIDIVQSKGRACLAETSFRLDAFDAQGCAARVAEDCTDGDRARVVEWLDCWDSLPSCTDNNRPAFVSSGNACAKTSEIAAVARRCRVLIGDTSDR